MPEFSVGYIERLTKLESKLDIVLQDVASIKSLLAAKVHSHDIELESTKLKMRYLIGTVIALSTAVGYSPLVQLLK